MIEDRFLPKFWSKVKKTDTCWHWLGSYRFGPKRGIYRQNYAHRIAWIASGHALQRGEILTRMCKNASCVNPAHYKRDTTKALGKHRRLTDEQIVEMRELRAEGKTYREIGLQFGTCVDYTAEICTGAARRDSGGPITPRATRRKWTKKELAKLSARREKGETYRQIADSIGCAETTLATALCKYDYWLRGVAVSDGRIVKLP